MHIGIKFNLIKSILLRKLLDQSYKRTIFKGRTKIANEKSETAMKLVTKTISPAPDHYDRTSTKFYVFSCETDRMRFGWVKTII